MQPEQVQHYANQLAQRVEQDWHRRNLSAVDFPRIAAQALRDMPFPEELNAEALFRYGLTFRDKAYQSNPGYAFGDPPLALCRRELFEVGVLFWLDGTTAIHQHAFSGAFQVLAGKSLHSHYRFAAKETINERLLFGDLVCEKTELLHKRDIREIVAGRDFIHSLFHLVRPSITLIIRTHSESSHGPQYSYHRPGIAIDPFHQPPEKILRKRLFHSLIGMREGIDHSIIEEAFRDASIEPKLNLLLDAAGILREANVRTERLVDLVVGERRDLRASVRELVENEIRVQNIVARRKEIVNEEHRFFLALLLNLPNRTAILEMISANNDESNPPITALIDWVRELTGLGEEGENKLGIDFDEPKLSVLEGLMRDKKGDALRNFVLEKMQAQQLPFSEKEFQIAQFILPELRIFKPLFH